MFDIRLEKRYEVRFTKALKAVDKRTRFWKDDLPRYFITSYYRAVLRAIETQKYAANYDPLSKKYKAWKAAHNMPTGFWRKTGETRKALQERAWKASPVSQSDDYVEYIGSLPASIAWYVGLTEWGYRGHGKGGAPMVIPFRQVFSPTLENMQSEFEAYTKRKLAELATDWGKK